MDSLSALKELSSHMHLEPAEDTGKTGIAACARHAPELKSEPYSIYPAVTPKGGHIRLLKTLQTSACERNCYYCPFRAGRDFRRATLSPDDMAKTFMGLQRAGIAEGLFLSSGIAGGSIRTQDKIIDTVEILREKMSYQGYIHLKLMPGAEYDQVLRAMQLADRVSLNLEAPNSERLALLAPRKTFIEELLQPLRWVEQIRRTLPGIKGWNGHWPSMTTQFVVGAVGETDLELLTTTAYLHNQLSLGRAYYSAFSPSPDTPFAGQPPASPQREQRLYQASFLLRDYGFDLEELPFDPTGNLPTQRDPKTIWAQDHLAGQPVEINKAERSELMRIPGIGPKSVKAILNARRQNKLRHLEDLYRMGINPGRSLPYILLDGQRPPHQLQLFAL